MLAVSVQPNYLLKVKKEELFFFFSQKKPNKPTTAKNPILLDYSNTLDYFLWGDFQFPSF